MRFMVSNQSMEVCALSGSRRVKKSQTPAGTVLAAPGQGQGRALGSCSPGAAAACAESRAETVCAVALIWDLAPTDMDRVDSKPPRSAGYN
jgi:hypothetical protein